MPRNKKLPENGWTELVDNIHITCRCKSISCCYPCTSVFLQALYENYEWVFLSMAGGARQSEPQVHLDDKEQKSGR